MESVGIRLLSLSKLKGVQAEN